MATKYRMGEEVVKLFNQTVLGGNITVQEAMLVASQASNKYVRDIILAGKMSGDQTVPFSCLVQYNVVVAQEASTNKYYLELPVRALEGIPDNGGVFQLTPAEDDSELIAPLNTGFTGMFKGLDSYYLEGRLGYIPRGRKLYLQGADYIPEGRTYTATIIPDATELEADADMPLPTDCEYDVITMAVELAKVKFSVQPNLVTDNTPK
jgi:hypothetical protein